MIRSRDFRALFVCILLVSAAPSARGQGGLNHLDDATVVPPGFFRIHVVTAWTRYDALFTPAGSSSRTLPLGAAFSSDSLGLLQLPRLANTQTAIQALTGSPFRLTLGSMQTVADARVVVSPFRAEYGLTPRLTLSVLVPFVRTRTSIFIRANPKGSEGNVGVNPASVSGAALAQDSAVVAQLVSATAALQTALQACRMNPMANSSCPVLLMRETEVSALLMSAASYSIALSAVYGSGANLPGAPVVPVVGSAADHLISGRIAQLDSSFHAFLTTAPTITARPAGARGVVGTDDLQTLLRDPAVGSIDSLATTERISVGDVEASATVLLHDGFADTTTRGASWRMRAALTGTLRLATGQTPTLGNPADIGTGNGTTQVEGRLATVIQRGAHLGISAAAQYTYSLTKGQSAAASIDARPAAGSSYEFQLAPRWRVGALLDLYAVYGFRHLNATNRVVPDIGFGLVPSAAAVAYHDGIYTEAGNAQSLGLGVHYSTVSAFDRGMAHLPIEVGFTHLETVSGAGQMPKSFRDQVEIRFYSPWNRR